jgi:hypothetical protein
VFDGTWKRVLDRLVEWVRVAEDRDPSPSVASIDSQTVPTAVMVNDSVSYDAGKKRMRARRVPRRFSAPSKPRGENVSQWWIH